MSRLRKVSLNDKYDLNTDRAYITGIEALVRLNIIQHQRDLDAGLNTAGFVSGYRGSPVGTVDQSMWQAKSILDQHNITFQPGVNEDLAATAVWGTQQAHFLPKPIYDGVFSMWYGKGPGVDRSMDVIKHANMFGTAKHGGVLAVAGDDHACKSSTVPHQSEHMFIGAAVPVLNPANVQDVLDFGIIGWALSRYSGCWVGLKAITENMDSAISADINPYRVNITLPTDFEQPECGLNGQWPTTPLEQEHLLNKYRIYAARAFAFSNNLNRITLDSDNARLGIVTSGKSYLDVMEALEDLGIDIETASQIGIRIFKIGMSWPLEPNSTHQFAKGLKEILVIEEKRSVIEDQITGQLYNWPVTERPIVIGEFDEYGHDLVTNLGELTPAIVARAIGSRITQFYESDSIKQRLAFLDVKESRLTQPNQALTRTPYFCSGCPHNTSTKVPDGSIGLAGIGCHYMVRWMDRDTELFTQMGGEGASWIGQAPFTEMDHVFQNIGDGTYFHSGILAIRAAIAANVNITYKILFNDAVAMTGGQPVDGTLTVSQLVAQLQGEGIKRLAVVSEQFEQSRQQLSGFKNITIHPKSEFDQLQRQIREVKGCSIIIFDQTCASEKRRRRKRGLMPESDTRVFIHPDICEGCGDCSIQSNCLSILPKQTELGTKRQIDQNACNKDFGCLDGFCPSFVTVTGASLTRHNQVIGDSNSGEIDIVLTAPDLPDLDKPWNVLITGIGGTGILTIGSILAMAAHIEGKGCSTLNQTGLAQKFGSVVSHVRIAEHQDQINAVRISDGDADLLLGCDLVVSASKDALSRLNENRSNAIINNYQNPTSDFIHDKNYQFPLQEMQQLIIREIGEANTQFVNATRIARDLFGDAIASNMFLLGYAYQLNTIPVHAEAINKAIALNGVAIKFNQQAFLWGRRAAINLDAVESKLTDSNPAFEALTDLNKVIDWRYQYLIKYQNKSYANKYLDLINKVRRFENSFLINPTEYRLTEATARSYFKLMAYKDEYEVARLYADDTFLDKLKQQFRGDIKITFHLVPPIFSKRDSQTGHLLKRKFPGVMMALFGLLAKLKFLRGSKLDLFGKTKERNIERQLIAEFEQELLAHLNDINESNYNTIVAITALPEMIKGFGHIKCTNIQKYYDSKKALLKKLNEPALSIVVNPQGL